MKQRIFNRGAITVVIAIVIFSLFSIQALAASTTTAQRNAIANDWTFYAQGTETYNCLAYALGNTTSWVWPWGASNPTFSQVQTYLNGKGYAESYKVGFIGPIQPCKITCYGTTSAITHFAKYTNTSNNTGWTGQVRAKWGACEIFTHSTPNPYVPTGIYGKQVAVFR